MHTGDLCYQACGEAGLMRNTDHQSSLKVTSTIITGVNITMALFEGQKNSEGAGLFVCFLVI
jgi:hypothetical protein